MKIKHSIKLLLPILPFMAGVVFLKLIVHRLDFEIIPLNALFASLIGANVFLLGFLINGVLADYKESERLPGEIASTLLTFVDEINFIELKNAEPGFIRERMLKIQELLVSIRKWLYKENKTREVMSLIEGLTGEFVQLEKLTPPNYIARLKQEQHNLRKLVTRIHSIRETNFVFSGYFVTFSMTLLLIIGMIFLEIEPFYESLFFVALVTYLLFFLLKLIRDLDNPFAYYENSSLENVSIKPIDDAILTINQKIT